MLQPKPVRAVEARRPFIRRIAAEPNPGPRASRPTFDFSETNWATSATIRALENKWHGAIKKHDAAIVDDLLDEDFEGTSTAGKTVSKARLLREIRQDENVYKSIHLRGVSVRSKGSAVAVISGIVVETGTTKQGQPFTHSRRFTDTWKERGGKWKCISSKATSLSKKER